MTGPARSASARPALGLAGLAVFVVGHTIGVGVFLTPAELIGALASPALTLGVWLACGALVLAGAFTFGELAARRPESGGLYVYLRDAWGDRAAFLYGWQCVLVMDPGITAALAAGVARYAPAIWPAAAGKGRWLAAGMIWALAVPALAGLRPSVRLLGALTAFKLLLIGGVAVLALTSSAASWGNFLPFAARRPGAPPIGQALGLGLVGAFFSFGGFWEASRLAGEVRDAPRRLPRALAGGVAAVTAAYLLTTAAFILLVPVELARDPASFARRAGEAMPGPSGGPVLAAGVAVSGLGSALALLIMAPRLYLAMGRDGFFPTSLSAPSALGRGSRSPARATLLLAALASVYALSGSFEQIAAFFMCTTLAFVALAAAGLFVLRRRDRETALFRCPGYPVTPLLFVLLLLAVGGLVATARPGPALAGILLVALGLAVHRVSFCRRPPRPAPPRGGVA